MTSSILIRGSVHPVMEAYYLQIFPISTCHLQWSLKSSSFSVPNTGSGGGTSARRPGGHGGFWRPGQLGAMGADGDGLKGLTWREPPFPEVTLAVCGLQWDTGTDTEGHTL